MTVQVEIVHEASDDIVDALNQLLPQLSSTANELTLTNLRELVDSSSTTVFVARNDRTLVGTLTLVVFRIPTGLRGWIEDVVVDESARGTGVGEALTLAAIEEAKRLGTRSLDLTTRPTRDAANRLYSRLGFDRRETNVYRFLVEPPEGDLK
jgi:ribosomal protein S18 acetylase RimI-like enzyme